MKKARQYKPDGIDSLWERIVELEAERDSIRDQDIAEQMVNLREMIGEMSWGIGLPSPFVMVAPEQFDKRIDPSTPLPEPKEIALNEDQVRPIFEAIYQRLCQAYPLTFIERREAQARNKALADAMRAMCEGCRIAGLRLDKDSRHRDQHREPMPIRCEAMPIRALKGTKL